MRQIIKCTDTKKWWEIWKIKEHCLHTKVIKRVKCGCKEKEVVEDWIEECCWCGSKWQWEYPC